MVMLYLKLAYSSLELILRVLLFYVYGLSLGTLHSIYIVTLIRCL